MNEAGKVAGWFLIFLSLLAVVLNLIVIIIVTRTLKREGSFSVLVLNLAIFDLLLAIVGVSLRGPALVVTGFFQLSPVLEHLCKVTALVIPGLSYASSLTVTLITINRAAAIISPHNYRSNMTFKTSIIMVAFVWATCAVFVVISICFSVFSDLIDLRYDERAGRCSLSITKFGESYVLATNAIFFVIPFLLTVCLYIKIINEIRARMKHSQQKISSNKTGSRNRIFVNISLLVGLYFISWFPQFVTQVLLHPSTGEVAVNLPVRYFTFVLFYLNLVCDPLVYTLHHHNTTLFCCLCRGKNHSDTLVTYNKKNSKSGVIENVSVSNVIARDHASNSQIGREATSNSH